ncbi:MAG: LCP family protein [Clostridium sp.]|uniref:LCP family protein n=1 Tax=Clostridium sp. TaxID=1506 RepID=UPI003F3BEFBE
MKKKKIVRNIVIGVVVAVAIVVGGTGIYAYHMLDKIQRVKLDNSKLDMDHSLDSASNQITNIALFGVDDRHQLAGHGDAEMIFTIDRKHDELKLTSIMRDSYVQVAGHGMDKITEAYFYGGPELALSTINKNFDMNINKFITVGLQTMPKVVNLVGGVDIDLKPGDVKWINEYIAGENRINHTNVPYIYTTGVHHLDGTQATAYSRIRYSGNCQERTARQRLVLTKIYEKLKQMPATKIPELLNEVLPYVKTNLTNAEFIEYGTEILEMNKSNILEARYPTNKLGHGIMVDGIFYEWLNQAETNKEMHAFIFGDPKKNQSEDQMQA